MRSTMDKFSASIKLLYYVRQLAGYPRRSRSGLNPRLAAKSLGDALNDIRRRSSSKRIKSTACTLVHPRSLLISLILHSSSTGQLHLTIQQPTPRRTNKFYYSSICKSSPSSLPLRHWVRPVHFSRNVPKSVLVLLPLHSVANLTLTELLTLHAKLVSWLTRAP